MLFDQFFFFADHEQLWAAVAVSQLLGKSLGWSWNALEAVGALQPPHSCTPRFPKAALFLSGFLKAVGGAHHDPVGVWGAWVPTCNQHIFKLIRWLQPKWSDITPLTDSGNPVCLPQRQWGELNSLQDTRESTSARAIQGKPPTPTPPTCEHRVN